ncbi:MAG: adenylate/guanylate cyclase domain-containing protein [Hyphomicrobiaceae bacterium]|nr:adenylate/guanylate cyclase domain-containing protein [Hyphomicrobiaceae bacterium]
MHVLWRGHYLQRARLVSGLILFAFALTHFLNHAIGLVSVDLMQSAQEARQLITRSWIGTFVLAGALIVHMALALAKLAARTTLRMPPWEATQLALGLAIPILLLPHIVNTRIAHALYGVNDIYLYELLKLWPDGAIVQSALLVIVWVHGCMGLHFWLRLSAPYRRMRPALLAVAIVIPVASLGGFMVAGRAVNAIAQDPAVLESIKQMSHWPTAADADKLYWLRVIVRAEYIGLLGIVLLSLLWTWIARWAAPQVSVSFLGGPTIKAPQGATLLEMSRNARVPHAAVCGGRGRCSTCRVRVENGASSLEPPVFPESVTLGAINAPQNVRLACQIRPTSNLVVTRLLPPGSASPLMVDLDEADASGVEKSLAVMFVDMRGFTRLAHDRLPFDTVFILNQFFGAVGAAIVDNGGRIDKFMGDGLLAVFGQHTGVKSACRQALRTARAIDLALDEVNAKIESEIGTTLQVGIGLDAGPLLLGRIGFGEAVDYTVIGAPVNVASRLEGLAKEKSLQVMLSAGVAQQADWTPAADFAGEIAVRGVTDPVHVFGFKRGRDFPASILAVGPEEQLPVRSRFART